MSNSLDPDQARPSVGLIWVQTVCKSNQQTTLGDSQPLSDRTQVYPYNNSEDPDQLASHTVLNTVICHKVHTGKFV